MTARGGVNSADTTLLLAPTRRPVPASRRRTPAATWIAGSTRTVTWDVGGTDVAPVSTANVKISLSTDGGHTYPYVLAASTPNDGSQSVTLPNVATTHARIKVEAVGNVFFDVSNADFTTVLPGRDRARQCVVRAATARSSTASTRRRAVRLGNKGAP